MVLSVVLFILTFSVRDFPGMIVGPGFVPRIVALLLFGIGTGLLIQGIRNLRRKAGEDRTSAARGNSQAVIISFLLFTVYILLLERIGFIIMTTAYLFLQMSLLAPKGHLKPFLFLIISVVTSVSAFYLFVDFFRIMGPAGILG